MKRFEIWSKASASDHLLLRDGKPFVLGYYGSGKHYLEEEMVIRPYVTFKFPGGGTGDHFFFNENGSKIERHLVTNFETPGDIIAEYLNCINSKYCSVSNFIDRITDLYVITEMGF